MSIFSDASIQKAISKISDRSERSTDIQALVATFVDVGMVPQINNTRNQIIYGRRGSGKTHVLQVLANALSAEADTISVYIDCRTLGSSEQFTDPKVEIPLRCLSLFKDLVHSLYNPLLEYIVDRGSAPALDYLDEVVASVNRTEHKVQSMAVKESETISAEQKQGSQIEAKISSRPSVSGGFSSSIGETTQSTRSAEASHEVAEKIFFPDVHQKFKQFTDKLPCHMYVLIDEWASLPYDIQPYLAEFIKRAFFANPRITIKIASLEYRSNFSQRVDHGILGFELGTEISASLDLDDYFVYDRNPTIITNNFAEILMKHVRSLLPSDHLLTTYEISSEADFVRTFFSDSSTFKELVRASEGVIRDLLNIFIKAYFTSQRRTMSSIDKRSVIESAQQWFESDKSVSLDPAMNSVLKRIVEEVIGKRRARSFLLSREEENHQMIQRLFDARVLHVIKRGYSDKVNPGVRYNIYTLDYGTYVDLTNTSRAPDKDFDNGDEATDEVIVPFDDKRSIRRIILTPDILNAPALG
ncbi:MAG: AAA family ATPase [Leptonema illini]|uniref:AAA family ATPase n=1 Tax=Leptonema illini TaxID=183 RepID=A0A833H2B0_9LEPT|nr:MAG: AAA family ATPase [Leptonema illini]